MSQSETVQVAILGGGLAGSLAALAITAAHPDVSLSLIEAGETCGGNHIWSFFASDLDAAGHALVAPLVAARWPRHEVRFPGETRLLETAYRSITSEALDAAVRATLPARSLLTGARVTDITRDGITPDGATTRLSLADGRTLTADAVIDARGGHGFAGLAGGWQSFLGQMIETTTPHGLTHPRLMDARVDQHDGFRFVYCLPFSADTLFVEDTYYTTAPITDAAVLRQRIADYCTAQGWAIRAVRREEVGALPVIAAGERMDTARDRTARIGAAGGLFHPLTSYSLPLAVTTALALARLPALNQPAITTLITKLADANWRRGRFYRRLARMLFGAADPAERYRVFARFYRLDAELIERFYAGRSTLADQARVLIGRPPVAITRALVSLASRRGLVPLDAPPTIAAASPQASGAMGLAA